MFIESQAPLIATKKKLHREDTEKKKRFFQHTRGKIISSHLHEQEVTAAPAAVMPVAGCPRAPDISTAGAAVRLKTFRRNRL
jgi:hypothetical protein